MSQLDPLEIYNRLEVGVSRLQSSLTNLPFSDVKLVDEGVLQRRIDGAEQIGSEKKEELFRSSMLTLSHGHFTNYGGGYYSYLFARMYAAQIWECVFARDPLSREAGTRYWKEFLAYGASKEPKEILAKIAGGPLDPTFFLRRFCSKK